MAVAVMLKTPAQSFCTNTALSAYADGNNISSVCISFIDSYPNSEEVRPQGCKVDIAPRARRDSLALSAQMTCGTGNMCCAITTTRPAVVDVVGLRRHSDKVDCNSGVVPVNRWVYICVA